MIPDTPMSNAESWNPNTKRPHLFKLGDVTFPLEKNCYDGLILALTCFLDPQYVALHGREATALQLVMATALLLLSVGIEVCLIFMLLITTTQKTEDEMEHALPKEIHALETVLAKKPLVPWSKEEFASSLCSKLTTYTGVHYLILLLWGGKMMQEFVHVAWRSMLVWQMPLVELGVPLMEEDDDATIRITHNTKLTKACDILFMIIPQGAIALTLYWTGAKCLFLAESMGNLIMRSICLAFIVDIDELIYTAFAPLRFRIRLTRSSFIYRVERPSWNWSMWGSNMLKVAVVVILAVYVHDYAFYPVVRMRRLCHRYFDAFPSTTPIRGAESLLESIMKGFRPVES